MESDQQLGSNIKGKKKISVAYPFRYIAQEQRFLFFLIGFAITCLVFKAIPSVSWPERRLIPVSKESALIHLGSESIRGRSAHVYHDQISYFRAGGRVPLGLKHKRLRVLVTGGAGFVGSHLVDRLMARGDSVIVVDNFFTGQKENLFHHFRNPRFELIRHDVVEPILLEVDQIYHLACPASPVHYKYNPVKTIKTNVMGTLNMLGLAKRIGARFLLTSTSEVYGDPLEHPQSETYWGNVNPIGVRMALSIQNAVAATALLLMLAMPKSQSFDFQYDFNNGKKPETLILQGDAHFPPTSVSTHARLTKTDDAGATPLKSSAGRILHSVPVPFWEPGAQVDLETTIKFSIKGKANDNEPADGIVFFIAPVGTTIPSGSQGGNFGIFDAAGNGSSIFAVEFDIYPNEWDPSFRHVGIDIESRKSVSVTEISDSLDGDEVTLLIDYEEATRVIRAAVTTSSNRYEVSYVYDLSTILPQQVQVGIAASTGEFVAIHDIISWYFTATMVHHGSVEGNIRQVA